MSLVKQSRFSARDFAKTRRQKGVFGAGVFLKVKITKSSISQNKYGFVVSNQVSKKAVKRNKIKRRLKAIIRGLDADIKNKLNIIIIALPAAQNADFNELKRDIIVILQYLNIFND